jgi:hypothetical protein
LDKIDQVLIISVGISKSELMSRSSDIKVLTPEEIEGVRKACAVSAQYIYNEEPCLLI